MHFNLGNIDLKNSTFERLRKMSPMIHNLNVVGNVLTEVQQILGYTARLPKSLDTMKLTMMHNYSIITSSQLSCHLELVEERHRFQTNANDIK